MWGTEINKTHTEGLETDPCIKEKEEINDFTEANSLPGSGLRQLTVRKILRKVWVKKQHYSCRGSRSGILVTFGSSQILQSFSNPRGYPWGNGPLFYYHVPKYLVYQQHSIGQKMLFLYNANMLVGFLLRANMNGLLADAIPNA